MREKKKVKTCFTISVNQAGQIPLGAGLSWKGLLVPRDWEIHFLTQKKGQR